MRLLHSGAPDSALVWVRRLLFGIWFLVVAFSPLQRLALVPAEVFNPPFPISLVPDDLQDSFISSSEALLSFRVVTSIAVLLAFFGIAFRWVGPLAILLIICHQAVSRGYGYVNHAEVALILSTAMYVLFTIGRRKARPEQTLFAVTLVFLLTYVLIGIHRLAFGMPDVFLLPKMEAWSVEQGYRIAFWTFGWGRYVADSPLLAAALRGGFVLGTVMEALALFALVNRPFRIAFIAIMLPMHLFILLLMNIAFFENMAMFLLLIDMGSVRCKFPCLVLFDGVCNFCNGFVNFLQKRDPERTIYFVASQSEAGRALMKEHRITEAEVAATVFAIEGERISSRSTAVLQIAGRLTLPWRLISELAIIPVSVRDGIYKIFSANRYRWFGKSAECRIPTAEERARYLQSEADLARIDANSEGREPGMAGNIDRASIR